VGVKTKILSLLKNSNFLSLSSNMVVAVFGFFSFLILVRTLDPDHFGEWVLYITAGNFIEMLRFGITRTAIIRFLSGAKKNERKKLIGANWIIGLITTAIVAALLWIIYNIFPTAISNSGFSLFFIWYPLLAFVNLPFNNALSILQADQRFDRILLLRALNVGSFVVFLLVNFFVLHWGLMLILYVHLAINLLTSVFSFILRWDGVRYIFHAGKKAIKELLDFGKYTTGTLIGSNLLKSSDTFIIGLSPFLGTAGVAFYSVPLKLTEILEIPLRSTIATAFPRMSKASIQKNVEEVKNIYYAYTGAMTYLLIPIVIIGFIFAEEFVLILGGREYLETATIFRIFCVYGLFLPIDKFTGVALDSINKPKKNFYKVLYMAFANIFGDSVVIFLVSKFLLGFSLAVLLFGSGTGISYLSESATGYAFITTLELVAIVTIIFTIIGIIVGQYYLRQEIKIQFRQIFLHGWGFILYMIESTIPGLNLIKKR